MGGSWSLPRFLFSTNRKYRCYRCLPLEVNYQSARLKSPTFSFAFAFTFSLFPALCSISARPPVSLLFHFHFHFFFHFCFHLFTFPRPVFNLSLAASIIAFMRRQPGPRLPIWRRAGLCLIYEKIANKSKRLPKKSMVWLKDCQHAKLPVSEQKMWRRTGKCSVHIFSLEHSSKTGRSS